MRNRIVIKLIISIVFVFFSNIAYSQTEFDDFFISKTLRLDYHNAGNADTSMIFFERLKEEPFWGGSKVNLIDKFAYGDYMLSVFDSISNKLIYSRGYSTLFLEWQTTKEAKKINKSFYETVIMPYPKKTIRIELSIRDKKNKFTTIFKLDVNPDNYFIVAENTPRLKYHKIVNSGMSNKKLDIVIISEGYKKSEMKKFLADSERLTDSLFSFSPFKENKDKFNVWIVEAPSINSGTDIPGHDIWKETVLNSNFFTFDSERYLTTKDIKTTRNIAAVVPYDQIYILVNTAKYGGGAIYNHYNLSCSDHALAHFVFVHELGHGFASLADEYYTSDVSYNDYYDLTVEPYQANITTLVDFDKKWKSMLDKNTPVPTPTTKKYIDKLGVFEGGGYLAKGIYRPKFNCLMKSFSTNEFCPVCKKAIIEMIKFYTE